MVLEILSQDFAVCKIDKNQPVDLSNDFIFLGKTDEELSLVCPVEHLPATVQECEKSWRAFRVKGPLEFALIGILSKISTLLANNGISIFAISTYNTDYILLKSESFEKAVTVLQEDGYTCAFCKN